MVNLLLNVHGVDMLALNSEYMTLFEIASEGAEYHESFRMIRKLRDFMIRKLRDLRRWLELVVATLLAAMTCAAAFTVLGGFDTETAVKEERGSPILISYISVKLFLIFDCIAFFLSLFVCIRREMGSELTTGDKMLFMSVNSVVVCCSFAISAYVHDE